MSAGVVMGYDGSDSAKVALTVAADLAQARGEKLVVVFAYELDRAIGGLRDNHLALRQLAQTRLEEAAAMAAETGAEVEAVIVEDSPAKALLDLAESRDARMIVVGTRGERPLTGALLGSTPHKLMHLSTRPVLVVPT
ncbi:MAG: universal stress protein [Conexibacteraceae bacterium]|nr:universal stress protein [Conexibacteraceae bacterium]